MPALGRWSGSPGWLVSDPIRTGLGGGPGSAEAEAQRALASACHAEGTELRGTVVESHQSGVRFAVEAISPSPASGGPVVSLRALEPTECGGAPPPLSQVPLFDFYRIFGLN